MPGDDVVQLGELVWVGLFDLLEEVLVHLHLFHFGLDLGRLQLVSLEATAR